MLPDNQTEEILGGFTVDSATFYIKEELQDLNLTVMVIRIKLTCALIILNSYHE